MYNSQANGWNNIQPCGDGYIMGNLDITDALANISDNKDGRVLTVEGREVGNVGRTREQRC